MNRNSTVSQRLLRKGALTAETYSLFKGWNDSLSFEDNLRIGLSGGFRTTSWENEVRTTLRRRFKIDQGAHSLIRMAQLGLPFDEWCSCYLLWLSINEALFREFVLDWLFPEFVRGRYVVTVEEVAPFTSHAWTRLNPDASSLSDYGLVRTARDMVRMATDFGLLVGSGSKRKFGSYHLTDRSFMYWLHSISEFEGASSLAPQSKLWGLALMQQEDVENTLMRLHQFRKLDYQVAGSLVQLSLLSENSRKYVEEMMI